MHIFAGYLKTNMIKLLRSSIFAGIAIGAAGFGFLASGIQSETYGSLVGAIIFSFGLLTVLGYKLKLYTGTAGFFQKGELNARRTALHCMRLHSLRSRCILLPLCTRCILEGSLYSDPFGICLYSTWQSYRMQSLSHCTC